MTGPEFALSIIASMIAAVLYDMLRNPLPPTFTPRTISRRKALSSRARRLAEKLVDVNGWLSYASSQIRQSFKKIPHFQNALALPKFIFSKKADVARPAVTSQLTHPDSDHFASRAFLKKSFI
jgi:hypothetical protein